MQLTAKVHSGTIQSPSEKTRTDYSGKDPVLVFFFVEQLEDQPLDQFKAEVDRHIRELRNTRALPGQTVRLPGEHRAQRRADRLSNGLLLAPELLTQLDKLAAELSIKPLHDRA